MRKRSKFGPTGCESSNRGQYEPEFFTRGHRDRKKMVATRTTDPASRHHAIYNSGHVGKSAFNYTLRRSVRHGFPARLLRIQANTVAQSQLAGRRVLKLFSDRNSATIPHVELSWVLLCGHTGLYPDESAIGLFDACCPETHRRRDRHLP